MSESTEQTLRLASLRSADARQAVRDFQRKSGSSYSVLYLRDGPKDVTCVVFIQRSGTHFTRYAYRAHRVDSTRVVSRHLPQTLAQLQRGCYFTSCEIISIPATYRILITKQGKQVKGGLSFTDYCAQDFTTADQARLAPAVALMRVLDEEL
ncbi:MAG: hypothetical protein ACRYFK_04680 [Janthinobacterium lividum]